MDKLLVFQAVRKSDHRVVSWYQREGVPHLLPAVNNEMGAESLLDMRVQWNEADFFAQVFTSAALREGQSVKVLLPGHVKPLNAWVLESDNATYAQVRLSGGGEYRVALSSIVERL